MSRSATRPLDPLWWIGLPMVLALVGTLVFLLPIRPFGLRLPEPVFAMVLAFAWAVIRPSVIAPFALLAMGVIMDILWGSPLGLWSLALLIAHGVIFSVRSVLAGQSLGVMWVWYGAACMVAELAAYLLTQILAQAVPNLISAGWQILATVLLYPFAHLLIDRFEDADVRFR